MGAHQAVLYQEANLVNPPALAGKAAQAACPP